ncbi:MAG TPA: dihydrolipoyl dehydrogenase [Methanotrichaceae archaeon]|nr:dihydrolipoyl dehydrogenase [Methanotrichaceae archaeon]
MDQFDLIVVGSGAGMHIVSSAVEHGLEVALVDKGPMGGTCLNSGCIPSKILIYPADVVRTLQDARAVGIEGVIIKADFAGIMERMRSAVSRSREDMIDAVRSNDNVVWYKGTGEFVGDRSIKIEENTISASKILIASGARAFIPPIPGLAEAGYLDNVSVMSLKELPKSIAILGAGYIGCEFGHFFSAMGAEVTVIGRSPDVLDREDPEISQIANRAFSKYMKIHTSHEVVRVDTEGKKKVVTAINHIDGKTYSFAADEIVVAAGRRSNSNLLKPEMTGVETDDKGWIKVNEYLETSKPGIWALGDATGRHMFRHTANYEASVVARNMFDDVKEKADFHAVPHAVFTYPQVAAVGLTENEAIEAGYKVLVGRARYTEVAKGFAMAEEDGFAKVIIEDGTGTILGCSVIGSEAATLVQQMVYIMNAEEGDFAPLVRSQVIHPTISEVIIRAFSRLEHPLDSGPKRDEPKEASGK